MLLSLLFNLATMCPTQFLVHGLPYTWCLACAPGPALPGHPFVRSRAHRVHLTCSSLPVITVSPSISCATNCRVTVPPSSAHHAAHVPGSGPGVDVHAAHGAAIRGRQDLPPPGRLALEARQRRLWHRECIWADHVLHVIYLCGCYNCMSLQECSGVSSTAAAEVQQPQCWA